MHGSRLPLNAISRVVEPTFAETSSDLVYPLGGVDDMGEKYFIVLALSPLPDKTSAFLRLAIE